MDSWREPPALIPVVVSDYLKAGPRRILATFRAALDDPIERKVPGIEVPALVIRGESDPIAPERWTRGLCRRFPQARHAILPKAAHAAVFSAPAPFSRLVICFIARHVFQAVSGP